MFNFSETFQTFIVISLYSSSSMKTDGNSLFSWNSNTETAWEVNRFNQYVGLCFDCTSKLYPISILYLLRHEYRCWNPDDLHSGIHFSGRCTHMLNGYFKNVFDWFFFCPQILWIAERLAHRQWNFSCVLRVHNESHLLHTRISRMANSPRPKWRRP